VVLAARDWARHVGRAERESGAAGAPTIPLHDPRDLGHSRVERLELDGERLRSHAGLMAAGVPITNPVAGFRPAW